MNKTTYELRELQSKDVFPMLKIISKIGIKEFKQCFESEEMKALANSMKDEEGKADVNAVGIAIMFDMASLVIAHIPDCEGDIYQLLSQLSGMKKEQIASLSMAEFAAMIIDVFKQDGFMDFIQVVSGLFK